ncbi:uncharacterized protein MAM_01457 [Metarhizium album ARSEF 1941]|uniref:Uncharacterized protein n=1 Tax=Metarhizium album (strain ARSEF 1941) TaxID=1081103 RepID=A0A0B2X2X8_METAS|nr:uncharacterized protein MAM_01457 [Metarhizium album ARSEF 1941]KHO00679.1 hypothetical protein MAM_01457 [Metarhizium album ARSEF 1941]
MAPGSAISISYQDQIKSNCRMYLGRDAKLHIITALDAKHSPPWAAYLMQSDARGQVCVLSAEGNTVQAVFTKMHHESARAVQRHVQANGFQSAEGPKQQKAKSRRGKSLPNYEDYLDSPSGSEDEGHMSDASTGSTRSSVVSSRSSAPILTPPASTNSTVASPERTLAAGSGFFPVMMNPVPPLGVPVPPPGWPSRYNTATHPPPPLPPLPYPCGATHPMILTLKSKAYGELMVLDRCSLNYAVILARVSEVLLERFHEFPRALVALPSRLQIRQMRLEMESVTVNGEKYVLGGGPWDLSALPLGPAPKGLNIVLSVEDGASG